MHTVFRLLLVVVLGCGLAPAAFAQPPSDLSPAEMLKRADADGDGTVSRDEFIKSRAAMLEERFARMDSDGDGKLDEQEVAAAAEEMRSRAGGRDGLRPDGPRPPRPGADRPRPDGERPGWADGERPRRPDGERPPRPDGERPRRPDGERPPRPGGGGFGEQGFDRFDRDGDGTLSREEFADGMARMREFMPGGGPGPGRPDRGGPGGPDRGGRGPAEGFRRPPPQD